MDKKKKDFVPLLKAFIPLFSLAGPKARLLLLVSAAVYIQFYIHALKS